MNESARAFGLGALGAPTLAQESESIRDITVKEILAACEGADTAGIWRHSDALVKLGNPAKRYIRNAIKGSSNEAKLAGLRALVVLDSPTFAAEKLMDLAADEKAKEDHRVLALELLGQTEEVDAEEGLLELLVTYKPRIRIAAARALWALDGEHAGKAKTALVELLKSADPELRAQGALALAEMGDFMTPGVRQTLLELRKAPGDRGKLATALYQKLQLQKVLAAVDRKADRSARQGPWRHQDEIWALLRRFYDTTDPEALDEARLRANAARGLVNFVDDPHTVFLSPEQYKEFMHGSDGIDPSYGGIGAYINTNIRDRFEILRPIFGGPAWTSDIRGGDVIVAVNGDPTRGRSTTDIIKQVKGPPGTAVILTIAREGWRETKDIEVIRAKIVLPSVIARMLPGSVGYVLITQFSQETGKELKTALTALEKQGIKGLVVDLRDNPGGALRAVKECLTLFLKKGQLICNIKGRAYRPEKHFAAVPDRERSYPISVLINGISASGAELMSGVMQHYSRSSKLTAFEQGHLDAIVFGTRSFGKGTVQHTRALESWPGESFKDMRRKNGYYNFGEPFTDENGNNRWDPGEKFVDLALLNERWDDAEPWKDSNGNGVRDEGEAYTDENKDGEWNPAEPYKDANENGEYDYGAALKLTVARYYLPSGYNFTRKRTLNKETNKYEYRGGVEPDVVAENHRWETAHLVELRELQLKGVFREYAKKYWKTHEKLLRELARSDGRDPARYPDFGVFFTGLKTRLTKQEVRLALRIAVRREVMARSGKEIVGDLSDDQVLLRGAISVLKRAGEDPNAIEEYRDLGAPAPAKK